MITIGILFFGECRDLTGIDRTTTALPDEARVSAALDAAMARFPGLMKLADRVLVAVNEEYAALDHTLSDGDLVAIFPPVSGGQTDDRFEIVREPIDPAILLQQCARPQDGAVVTFEGVVRDHSMGKPVSYLEYEAYESMALKMMRQIGQEVHVRWSIGRILMVHRLGRLDIGEMSVAIVVSAPHRGPAFEACRHAIDRLKKIVPIWKREYFTDGAVWVEGEGPSILEPPGTSR